MGVVGNVSRSSIRSGSRSAARVGISLQRNEIDAAKEALRKDSPSNAGDIVAKYVVDGIIAGTGIGLLIGVIQATLYIIKKLRRYETLVQQYGEDEGAKRFLIETGIELSGEALKQLLVKQITDKLISEQTLPPELKDRTEDIVQDIVEVGIDKIEERFLEE